MANIIKSNSNIIATDDNADCVCINSTATQGVVGTWKGYDVQAVSLNPGDVLLVHISSYMDLNNCRHIMQTLEETFPNNKCVLCNEHVLKGLTVIRAAENKKVDDVVNIATDVDIDALFNEIMKGNTNDFLY